ncbi:C-C chemokine receptor type 5 [Anabarilius grahami]|uniref:C-C chemokine receptor type 5 n=1 Tax=Anabarilius grahami TaxID=495550 RepID=A0A3N0YMD3_ANAGA|nr:C-C chemokine receptor type 5 [Anabarilius grahami]
MNNSTVNSTTPEASTNSTNQSIGVLDNLDICGYSIAFLFGLPTHSYIIWLIITGKGSGVASEFFILNLSVCELGICLDSLVFILSRWISRDIEIFDFFLIGLTFTGRPLFQCLISVERYLAVVHPVNFLKYKPLRYRVICCTVAWIITLGSCFSSEAVRTRREKERERGGKPHEEKSVSSHSSNYCDHDYPIFPTCNHRNLCHSDSRQFSNSLVH